MKPLIKQTKSFPVTIYIAGSYSKAITAVQEYCDTKGFCVTIKPALYVYTNGKEHGVEVGLINYPRFPSDPATIVSKALAIANLLREKLDQESFSIQTPHETIWHSYRTTDTTDITDE